MTRKRMRKMRTRRAISLKEADRCPELVQLHVNGPFQKTVRKHYLAWTYLQTLRSASDACSHSVSISDPCFKELTDATA